MLHYTYERVRFYLSFKIISATNAEKLEFHLSCKVCNWELDILQKKFALGKLRFSVLKRLIIPE